MKGLSLFFKEFKEFYRFFRIDKNEREIVFYSEDIASYSYFEGIVNFLTTHYGLKVYYVTSDPSDPILSEKRTNINVASPKSPINPKTEINTSGTSVNCKDTFQLNSI